MIDVAWLLFIVASIGPPSGALLVIGIFRSAAVDRGARSSREAMIMPATTDVNAIRKP